jgi:hypothetical protein
MQWPRMIVSLLLPVVLTGCTMFPNAKVSVKHDDFTGTNTAIMSDNVLAGGIGYSSNGQVSFNPGRVQSEGSVDPIYCIYIVYVGYGTGWCFIESGDSLRLLIDGERVVLSGNGSHGDREVSGGGAVMEVAAYPVEPDLLRKIASAKEVRVQIDGSRQKLERHFSEKNLQQVREFVALYVDNTHAEASCALRSDDGR